MEKNDWKEILPMGFPNGKTKPYGFVVDHHTYLGIPIPGLPGFPDDPTPTQPSDPSTAPKALIIKKKPPPKSETSQWTGGDFSVLAMRTPPLFHAFHHKTDEHSGGGHGSSEHFAFEPRAEVNVLERPDFQPRGPLPGRGRDAGVELLSITFDQNGTAKDIDLPNTDRIPFSDFDNRKLVEDAREKDYFATYRMTWNNSLVGPLSFLWLVFLEADKKNTPIGRLGGGYRLWHRLAKHGGHDAVDDGYHWTIFQRNDYRDIKVNVILSGALNNGQKRCPAEWVHLTFEFQWSS